jgi:hypothetical protein
MKGMAAGLLLILLANPVTSAAVARDKAAYVGGTLARFNRTGTAIEGRVEISPRHFVFVPESQLEQQRNRPVVGRRTGTPSALPQARFCLGPSSPRNSSGR